jgi:putative ABC transport system permease protein
MDNILQDLRYAARVLLNKPGFSVVAVVTLALGIGANTAIFSVVNSVLLQPLPFPDSDRLVVVFGKTQKSPRMWASYPDVLDWRERSELFSEFAGFAGQSVNLTGTEEPTRVVGSFVSANFFTALKVEAAEGRTFLPAEDEPGGERVVVVSHSIWQERFGGVPDLIGRSLTLNGQPYTVVGILPQGFRFQWGDADVWMPLQHFPNFSRDRAQQVAAVLGRLKPGVTLNQAQIEMDSIAGQLAETYPQTNEGRGVSVLNLQDVLTEDLKPSLLVLLGVVGCVLLIACANVANLLLSRAISRHREYSVRAALGASRRRLVRQSLTESLMLSFAGGGLGVLVGVWGADLLAANSPASLPPGVTVTLDFNVLAFTFALSAVTGILFGLTPAIRFSQPDLLAGLKQDTRSGGIGGRNRLRSALVVSQIALSFVLLIGSGLMLKSFWNLVSVNPGFNPANLLTLEYRVPRGKYPKGQQQWDFHRQVVERVRALSGIESAAVVLALPYSGNFGSVDYYPLDRPEPPKGQELRAQRNTADTHYFHTMQIPVLRGRVFTDQDREGGAPVVVINKTMAERLWPGEDPIDKQVRVIDSFLTETTGVASVIGVVGDVKHNGLDEDATAQIYVPYAQHPWIFATLVVRTQSDSMARAQDVRAAVWSVDKDQPVWKIRTSESLIERSIGPRRFVMGLLGGFSALAMLLAAIGIYGSMSYMVSQRTKEIGVRMALGAKRSNVLSIVVGRAMILTSIGVAGGAAIAIAVTRLIATFLFGVSATDVVTFVSVASVLTLVAMAACYLPARAAMRVDPMVALRYE